MTIGERIKQKRQELGLSQEEVADKLGYKSRTSVFKVEHGITDLPLSKVKEFAEVLKTTPAYLMGWEEDEKEKRKTPTSNVAGIIKTMRLPMYGSASAGNGYITLSEEIGYFDVPIEYCTNNDVYTTKVSGDSMTGLDKAIPDGSVAVVDPRLCSTPEALNGKVCIFTYNDETYIKQLIIDKQGIIILKSFNPNYDDIIVLKPEHLKCEGGVIVTFTQNNW